MDIRTPYQKYRQRHRQRVLRGLLITAVALCVLFVAVNLWITGNVRVAGVEAAFGAVLGFLLYRNYQHPLSDNGDVSSIAIVLSTLILISVLFTRGQDLHVVWLLALPIMLYFLLGRASIKWLALMFALVAGALMAYGAGRWEMLTLTPASMLNLIGAFLGVSLMAYFHERSRSDAEEAIQSMALTDSLTGIWNRRFFTEQAEQEVERARRYEFPLSLIIIDIDQFKRINDTHGHDAGDLVIRHLASLLTNRIRTSDTVARLGDDEFAILLPHATLSEAAVVAENLRAAVAESGVAWRGNSLRYTISLGVGECGASMAFPHFYQSTDIALNQAKADGRNTFSLANR